MAQKAMTRSPQEGSRDGEVDAEQASALLPLPPIESTADLHHLPWMKWPFEMTVGSEAWVAASPWEQLARTNLIAAAWRSVPAGSLPWEEKILKALSKSGARWPKIRSFALEGFKRHADNRLYHPVLTALAQETWKHVLSNRARQAQFRARRANRDVTVTRGVTYLARDNEIGEKKLGDDRQLPPAEPWDARTRGFAEDIAMGKTKPFWPARQWGPPPNSPGTQVPPELLMRYGIVPTPDESNRSE